MSKANIQWYTYCMPFSKTAALSLSLFVLALSSPVAASDFKATLEKLTPALSAQQQELKVEVNTSAYLARVATTVRPFLTGYCSKEVAQFTRTQWNNSCNARYNVYDADAAEYKSVSYNGLLAGYLDKTPVFIVDSDTVDAMMLKGAAADSTAKPFIVVTTGLVNTLEDNPVGLEFVLRHEHGHASYNHTPSPAGANDSASLQHTKNIELEADAFAMDYIQKKYSPGAIKAGLSKMADDFSADFLVLPISVRSEMKSLFDVRMEVIQHRLEQVHQPELSL